jgi:hypothetical protein
MVSADAEECYGKDMVPIGNNSSGAPVVLRSTYILENTI